MENGEDPFASIVEDCIPTASAEEKMRRCYYTDYSPNLSDSFSSSPPMTPPEEPSIFTEPPPESGSVAQSITHKNGVSPIYPEHASSSSQPYPSGPVYPIPRPRAEIVDPLVSSSPPMMPPEQPAIFTEPPPERGSVAQSIIHKNGASRIINPERASSSSQPYPSGPEYPIAAVLLGKRKLPAVLLGKRKLPASITGCKNASDDGNKKLSFRELMNFAEALLRMDTDSSPETAENAGYKSPRPEGSGK